MNGGIMEKEEAQDIEELRLEKEFGVNAGMIV